MDRRLEWMSRSALHTQRFGGMRIALMGCDRAAPHSVWVTCSFDFHQTGGRTGFVLTVQSSRGEVFDHSFPATALEVSNIGPRARGPVNFASESHTPVRYHFAVPPSVHALQRLRYNVGDTIFVFNNIAIR